MVQGKPGEKKTVRTAFRNTGKSPQAIKELSFSCGCLNPRVFYKGELYSPAEIKKKPLLLSPGERAFLSFRLKIPQSSRKDSFSLLAGAYSLSGTMTQEGVLTHSFSYRGKKVRNYDDLPFSFSSRENMEMEILVRRTDKKKLTPPKIEVLPSGYQIVPIWVPLGEKKGKVRLLFKRVFFSPEDAKSLRFRIVFRFPGKERWDFFGQGRVPDLGVYTRPTDLVFGVCLRGKTYNRDINIQFTKKLLPWKDARVLSKDPMLRSYLRVQKMGFDPTEKRYLFRVSVLSGAPKGLVQTKIAFRFGGAPEDLIVPVSAFVK